MVTKMGVDNGEAQRKGSIAVSKILYQGLGIRHVQMTCMCITMIALFIARSSMGVAVLAMTDLKRRNDTSVTIYEWDKQTQGLILSSFFWGYMSMQIPAGVLAKRFGGKPILMMALLSSGVICLLLPVLADVGGWKLVCASRVVMGFSQACTFPASHTLLGRWLPEHERTTLTGIVYGGSQIGIIIGMALSGFLAETAIGWKLIFYVVAGLMFVTAAIWYLFSASTPGEHRMINHEERFYIEKGLNTGTKGNLKTPWKDIFSTRAMWVTAVMHVGCASVYVLFFVDMPTYLERALGIPLKSSAFLSALPYIGMWAGNVVSSWLCEKIYNKGWLSIVACRKLFNSIAFFGMGIGLICLAFLGPENKSLTVITLVASLTINGFYTAGFMMNHLDMSPNFAGVLLSLTNFGANFGSVLTPIFTSLILRNDATDISRWRIVFLITASLSILSNVVYVIFGSTDRQPWDDPDYLDKKKADPEEMKPTLKQEKQEKVDASKQ